VKRPNNIPIKKAGISIFLQIMGKALVLVLALVIVSCAGASIATHSTPTPPQISPTSGPIEETAAPGSVKVNVTLVEFRIHSSVTVFHAGITYYFVIANRGHDFHEFMIMPDKPDGTPLSPDEQYKKMLIELEPIMPGTTWTTNFTFPTTGKYEIACQMGRHYQAGMRLPIIVNK